MEGLGKGGRKEEAFDLLARRKRRLEAEQLADDEERLAIRKRETALLLADVERRERESRAEDERLLQLQGKRKREASTADDAERASRRTTATMSAVAATTTTQLRTIPPTISPTTPTTVPTTQTEAEQLSSSGMLTIAASGETTPTIIVAQYGEPDVYFRIKKSTPLKKMFEAYAQRKGVHAHAFSFFIDGNRVKECDTVDSVGLEDGDQISVLLASTGD